MVTGSSTDTASNVIDGNINTRWSSLAPQAAGQFLQIDLGSTQSFNTLTMDSGPSASDYARGYQVYVSQTGTDWATQQPVATGAGTQAKVTANFAAQNARYIRIVQTGSDPFYWWSVAELSVGTAAAGVTNSVTFNVRYADGSGVNVDSLGNNNIVVTAPMASALRPRWSVSMIAPPTTATTSPLTP